MIFSIADVNPQKCSNSLIKIPMCYELCCVVSCNEFFFWTKMEILFLGFLKQMVLLQHYYRRWVMRLIEEELLLMIPRQFFNITCPGVGLKIVSLTTNINIIVGYIWYISQKPLTDLIIKKYESQTPLRFQNRLEYHVMPMFLLMQRCFKTYNFKKISECRDSGNIKSPFLWLNLTLVLIFLTIIFSKY